MCLAHTETNKNYFAADKIFFDVALINRRETKMFYEHI